MNYKDLNLRTLVYSNPLIVDKVSKTFKFFKDSGFIYTKNLIQNLPSSWKFYWIIPDKIKPDEYQWFYEANKNIELIPYPYLTGIHQNRYNFSITTLNKHFTYADDIDIVLNNQPEVSANFRVWFENQRRESPLIFSFYHWIDCKESQQFGKDLGGYATRQVDGAKASDYIMFHNQYAFNLFMNEAENLFSEKYLSTFKHKLLYFHPTYNIHPKGDINFNLPENKKIILFNHRLNNTTNWQEVLSVLDEIYTERKDFVLVITDDTKLKELSKLKQREYLIVKSFTNEEYGSIFKKAHFSVCNHKGYSTWNTSILDSFANQCLVLLPNREVYKDMFIQALNLFGREFSHNGNLKEMIIKLLDNSKEKNDSLAREIFEISKKTTIFGTMEDAESITDRTYNSIYDRLLVDPPKKYDEVLNFIKEKRVCLKKDWVNEFWSFHVNSNFPLIRKHLLTEKGLMDDTTSRNTLYKYEENKNG